MSMRTLAAVARKPGGDFVIEEVILADLLPHEVLVEVHATGICHMDIEARDSMTEPCVLGHEGAGVVLQTGKAVTQVHPGDRVIMGYGFCGHCSQCARHRPYFCERSWELTFGGKRTDGSATVFDQAGNPLSAAFFQQSSFARHAITAERSLVRIGAEVPWEVAAALPCGFLTGVGTAMNLLQVDSHSKLLVRGVGAVGMGAIVGARMAGCRSIIAVDIVASRLQKALALGASEIVDAHTSDFDAWFGAHHPGGCSHAFDSTGNRGVFKSSMNCLANGGDMAFAVLPVPMEEFAIELFPLFVKGASLKAVSFGSAVAAELLPQMLAWWASGKFPVESLIDTFPLGEINAAIAAAKSGAVIKPILLMQ